MSVLRIFPAGAGAGDWDLQDEPRGGVGAVVRERHDDSPFTGLPRTSRSVVIVPAARMRTLIVAVPPTPPAKLPAVVRFALEDQLAGEVDAQHVVIAARREGAAVVHVLERRWLQQVLAELAHHGVQPLRVVVESDLVPRAPSSLATWVWREDGGYLIEAGGRVTILDQSPDALPSGLLLALRRADTADGEKPRVVVRGPAQLAERSAAWMRATGVAFAIEPEWSWHDAPASVVSEAINLLTPDLAAGSANSPESRAPRVLRAALLWIAGALVLHGGATVGEWALLSWHAAQIERDTRQLIQSAAPGLTGDLDAAWRRHHAASRHRQGKTAPDDALPLIAQVAPALAGLPAGALRVINYEAGQLTLDFDRTAGAAIAAALPAWQGAGLSVLQAESPGGVRLRVAPR